MMSGIAPVRPLTDFVRYVGSFTTFTLAQRVGRRYHLDG
jgi:hypothetical protein